MKRIAANISAAVFCAVVVYVSSMGFLFENQGVELSSWISETVQDYRFNSALTEQNRINKEAGRYADRMR